MGLSPIPAQAHSHSCTDFSGIQVEGAVLFDCLEVTGVSHVRYFNNWREAFIFSGIINTIFSVFFGNNKAKL